MLRRWHRRDDRIRDDLRRQAILLFLLSVSQFTPYVVTAHPCLFVFVRSISASVGVVYMLNNICCDFVMFSSSFLFQ